jgi:hypothetical protein
MLWQEISKEVIKKLGDNLALAEGRPVIYVDARKQQLYFIDQDERESRIFDVSTAENGLGNRLDSYKTPLGIHRIKQKIGGGQPLGMIFEARQPVDRICKTFDTKDKDEITSRILWIDGLEEGFNRGGVHDSFSRYIYIHGTSDEGRIGKPVSQGCIRMRNEDVIALFDEVIVNDLVIIK